MTKPSKNSNSTRTLIVLSTFGTLIIVLSFFAGLAGSLLGNTLYSTTKDSSNTIQTVQLNTESAIIDVAEQASPSVVSIVITKDLPVYESFYYNPFEGDPNFDGLEFGIPRKRSLGTEEREIGAGSGFIISSTGLIITNRHVVEDTEAHYTAVFNDGSTEEAIVIDRDTILDIAVLQIETNKELTPLTIGDSDTLQIGQTAIAIGNSLGEFSNTVSAGIISGLSRSIIAGNNSGFRTERLEGVIQTDASINPGNSGGPLLDILGNVIGVNVAVAENAENIGFTIPINSVLPIIESVIEHGEIVRPFLGVRYIPVTEEISAAYNLEVNTGALLVAGDSGEPAVLDNSPASTAGLIEGDVILQIDNTEIDHNQTLQDIIQTYRVGDTISIIYWRSGAEHTATTVLEKL